MTLYVLPNVGVKLRVGKAMKGGDGMRPFVVAGPRSVLDYIARSLDVEMFDGFLSPLFNITLDKKARVASGIPPDAAFFAFSYPVAALGNAIETRKRMPRCSVLLFRFSQV